MTALALGLFVRVDTKIPIGFRSLFVVFFFNDAATTEIYTLSLHDALPICSGRTPGLRRRRGGGGAPRAMTPEPFQRSEEHTSELQSHVNLVCRLLLEKKKRSTNCTIGRST